MYYENVYCHECGIHKFDKLVDAVVTKVVNLLHVLKQILKKMNRIINMNCPKINSKPNLSICAELCHKKCDLISPIGKGREIGKMLRDIVKHCLNRRKSTRPLIDRRKIK